MPKLYTKIVDHVVRVEVGFNNWQSIERIKVQSGIGGYGLDSVISIIKLNSHSFSSEEA
jgi:hypothetical protein